MCKKLAHNYVFFAYFILGQREPIYYLKHFYNTDKYIAFTMKLDYGSYYDPTIIPKNEPY